MRLSEMHLKTLREVPSEAELASHILLLRTGMIRKLVSGVYGFMNMGYRSVRKIENIIREEMERHAPHRLLQVRARYGALANIVPEALSVAFEALTAGTDWEGAVLQAEEIPLSLKCSRCGQIFSPARQKRFSAPCPFCGEEQGHSIGAGRELYIQSMEAE